MFYHMPLQITYTLQTQVFQHFLHRMYRICTPKNHASMLTRQALVSAGLKLGKTHLTLLGQSRGEVLQLAQGSVNRYPPKCPFSPIAGMGAFLTFTVSWTVEAITES